MAETSYLWSTSSSGDGSGTYSRSDWSVITKIMGAATRDEGVCPKFLNLLNATSPSVNTLRVQSGGAIVDGKPYYNSANTDVTIPSASTPGNTRIDRVVLRADWSAQTVRLTRIAGTEAVNPSAPTITQTSGTTYDIYLYQVKVDTSGNLTITDERTMASEQAAIEYVIGDGTTEIGAGLKGVLEVPFSMVITGATIVSANGISGSIIVDIWKDSYANFPPTDADSITASAPPSLSSATKYQDTTLTGWTKTITAGDWLAFNVDSVTTLTQVVLSLKGYRL